MHSDPNTPRKPQTDKVGNPDTSTDGQARNTPSGRNRSSLQVPGTDQPAPGNEVSNRGAASPGAKRQKPAPSVQAVKAGVMLAIDEHLVIELSSSDAQIVSTIRAWVGLPIERARLDCLVPAEAELVWRQMRGERYFRGESYCRLGELFIHVYACGAPQGDHESVVRSFDAWIAGLRVGYSFGRNAACNSSGSTEVGGRAPCPSSGKPDAGSNATGSSPSLSPPSDGKVPPRQDGKALESYIVLMLVLLVCMIGLYAYRAGHRAEVVERVSLGRLQTLLPGAAMVPGPSRESRAAVWVYVQVQEKFYPMETPVVLHKDAEIFLITQRKGWRYLCDQTETVCSRTANQGQEIGVTNPPRPN
ncbi:hypothetical protein H6G33_38395 [Calothrix sp. FACHB-1219]|uniref:hypothetical protein n=1 Tax=Calothrix sp. FACHB-1219 TaxID=2692778 RepID=UPI0016883A35|nr:hypothetical protein [Calothrix sp. FACHB-1219]MBD2222788.1 hypothetical protein [Calothrix sp. FACHB-1219]